MALRRFVGEKNLFRKNRRDISQIVVAYQERDIAFARKNGINIICLEKNNQYYAFVYTNKNLRQMIAKIQENAKNLDYEDFNNYDSELLEAIMRNCNEI